MASKSKVKKCPKCKKADAVFKLEIKEWIPGIARCERIYGPAGERQTRVIATKFKCERCLHIFR